MNEQEIIETAKELIKVNSQNQSMRNNFADNVMARNDVIKDYLFRIIDHFLACKVMSSGAVVIANDISSLIDQLLNELTKELKRS